MKDRKGYFKRLDNETKKQFIFELIPTIIDSVDYYIDVKLFLSLYVDYLETGDFSCLPKLKEIMIKPRTNVFNFPENIEFIIKESNNSIALCVNMIDISGFQEMVLDLKRFNTEKNFNFFIDFIKFCWDYLERSYKICLLDIINKDYVEKCDVPIFAFRELMNIAKGTVYYDSFQTKYINMLKSNEIENDKIIKEIDAISKITNMSNNLNSEFKKLILDNIQKIDNIKILKNIASNISSEDHDFYDALYQIIQNSCLLCHIFFPNIKKNIKNKSFDYYFNQFQNDKFLISFLFQYLMEFGESSKESVNLENVLMKGFENNVSEIHDLFQSLEKNEWIYPYLNNVLLKLTSNLLFTTNIKLICEFLMVTKPNNFPFVKLTNFIYDYLNSNDIILFFIRYSFLPIGNIHYFWEFTEHDRMFFKLLKEKCLDQILDIKDKLICENCKFEEFKILLLDSYKKYPQNHDFLWKLSEVCQDNYVVNLINELIIKEKETIGDEIISVLNKKINVSQIFKQIDLSPIYGKNLYVQPITNEAKAFFALINNETKEDTLCNLINSDSIFAKEIVLQLILKNEIDFDWNLIQDTLKFAFDNSYNFLRDLCLDLLDKRKINHSYVLSKREINIIIKDMKNVDIFMYLSEFLNSFKNSSDFPEIFKCIINNIDKNELNVQKIWEIYFSKNVPSFLRTNETNQLLYNFIVQSDVNLFDLIKNDKVSFDESYFLLPHTKSYILQILMSLDLTWNNLGIISKEIRTVLINLLFNLSNDIDSRIDIDEFPSALRKMFEIFILQIKRQSVQTYLKIKPLISVQESLENEGLLIMNSPKVLHIKFTEKLNENFIIDEKIDTSLFSFSHNIYFLRAIVTKDKIVYKKYKNSFINLNSMKFIDKLPILEIQSIFYEFINEPLNLVNVWKSNESYLNDVNENYFVQGFLDDIQDKLILVDNDTTFCKNILDMIFNFKLQKLFSRIQNNQFVSEYFFENNISSKFLDGKFKDMFKEQIFELAKIYPDTAGLIFLLSEKNNIDYDFAFEIINQRNNIPYQTKIDLFSFFTQNMDNVYEYKSFHQYLINLINDDNASVNDIKQILRTYKFCFISLVKISDDNFIKYIPNEFYQNDNYLDIMCKYSTPNFLLKLFENNLNPKIFNKSFSKIKNCKAIFAKIPQIKEFKNDYEWIKIVLSDKNPEIRKYGQELMKNIWKNNENPNKGIIDLITNLIKNNNFYDEMISIIKYYIKWVSNSPKITKYILKYLFRKPKNNEEIFKIINELQPIDGSFIQKISRERESLLNNDSCFYYKIMIKLISRNPSIISYLTDKEKSNLENNLILEESNKQVILVLNSINNNNVLGSFDLLPIIPYEYKYLVVESLTKILEFPETKNSIFFLKYIYYSLNLFDYNQNKILENCIKCLKCILKQEKINFVSNINTEELIQQIIKIIEQFLSSKINDENILLLYLKFIKLMSLVSYDVMESIISYIERKNLYSLSSRQDIWRKISLLISKIFKEVIGDLQYKDGIKKAISVLNKQFSNCLSLTNYDFCTISPYIYIYLYIFDDSFKSQSIREIFVLEIGKIKNILNLFNIKNIEKQELLNLKRFIIKLSKFNISSLYDIKRLKEIQDKLSQSKNEELLKIVSFLMRRKTINH